MSALIPALFLPPDPSKKFCPLMCFSLERTPPSLPFLFVFCFPKDSAFPSLSAARVVVPISCFSFRSPVPPTLPPSAPRSPPSLPSSLQPYLFPHGLCVSPLLLLLLLLLLPSSGTTHGGSLCRFPFPASSLHNSQFSMRLSLQVFSSAFWIISFLPTLVTPLVAKAAASGDLDGVKKQVGEALFISLIIGMMGCLLMTFNAQLALQLVGVMPGSEAAMHAVPYIQ